MPRVSDTRARLTNAAARLFQQQGYHGTGLTQILDTAGAPKGVFYHHFPDGKDGLAEAAVRSAGSDVTGWVDAAFEGTGAFSEGIDRLITGVEDWFRSSGWAAGCPITAVLLETAPESERLRLACRDVMGDWAATVGRHARRLGVDDPDRLGLAVVLALEGAWITARARQDAEPFTLAAAMVKGLAQSSSGAPSGK